MLPEDYEGYSEWLMANAELHICNSRDLIHHLERETRYDEFLAYKESLNGLGTKG